MARDYFIHPETGQDDFPGTKTQPWRSLARVQDVGLGPGDRILLATEAAHHGTLILRNQFGDGNHPIFVTSYGGDRPAEILAEDGIAILIRNSGGITVCNLHLRGEGHPLNQTHGLCLFADERSDGVASRLNPFRYSRKFSDIVIMDVEIEGFGCAGLAVGGKADFGFENLQIRRVRSHHNAYAGIFIWGPGHEYVHENVAIDSCEVFENSGVPGLRHVNGHGHHSGHGILMCCVDGGLIENSKAYRNGRLNTAHVCGPAGIWASNSRNVTIRRNESFSNMTAGATDGGGFGFDGGMRDSLMVDNLSHDNDGSGFLMAQYYGTKPFMNNRFIGNTSLNDCRHNDCGAIHVWCPYELSMSNLVIERNLVQLSSSTRGRPKVFVIEAATENLRVTGNNFEAQGLDIIVDVAPMQEQFVFSENNVTGTGAVRWKGQVYEKVERWLELLPL